MYRVKGSRTSLSGVGKFVKCATFIVNFILFHGGLAVTGLAICVLAYSTLTSKVLDGEALVAPSAILLAFGCILAFVALLGCCGVILENRRLLLAFFLAILLITVLVVVGVALLAKNKDMVLDSLRTKLENTLDQYQRNEDTRQAWDYVQSQIQCCGVTTVGDWRWTGPPESCRCTVSRECFYQKDFLIGHYWRKGCEQRIREILSKVSTSLLAVAITVIVILFLSMIFTFALVSMLSKK